MLVQDLAQEFDALLPGVSTEGGATRRTALKAALGVGYAAATLPIMAQTAIQTPADGLLAGDVTIDAQGLQMPAYRAAPAGRTGLPVLLVVSEIFGVHAYVADVCRRLAHAGYLAIAPELFVRQGDPRAYPDIARLMAEVIAKVPDAQVQADLDATLQWAGAHGGDLARTGITGYCWGGRQTWLYAAHNPRVKAAVAWYGRLVGASSALAPQHPVDVAARLHAPVLGLYGEKDTGIPLESIAQMNLFSSVSLDRIALNVDYMRVAT